MKKFKDKTTGVVYAVTAQSVIEAFEKDARYDEVKEKTADKGKGKKETAPADENTGDNPAENDESNESTDNQE